MRLRFMAPLVMALALLASACGGDGACVGAFGNKSVGAYGECKEGFSEDECNQWDSEKVNGFPWAFHGGSSCAELGYTKQCNGSYVKSYCP